MVEVAVEQVEPVGIEEQQFDPNALISEDDLDVFAQGIFDMSQLETRRGRGRRRRRGEDPGGQAQEAEPAGQRTTVEPEVSAAQQARPTQRRPIRERTILQCMPLKVPKTRIV